jgi:hypothetical protein
MVDPQDDAEQEFSRDPQGGESNGHPILGYARPGAAQPGMRLVTVATFGDGWEAHLAIGKLEAEGIPAVLADENIVGTGGGIYTNLAGGIKLQVPEADIERALAALPSRVRTRIVPCPSCRKSDTRPVELTPGVKILFLLLLGIPYLFVTRPWVCLDCGHLFKPPPAPPDGDDDDDDDDDDAKGDGVAGGPTKDGPP